MTLTTEQTYRRFRLFQAKIEIKYTKQVRAIFLKQAYALNAYAALYGFDKAASKINDFITAAPFLPVLNNLHFEAAGKYGNDVYQQFKNVKSATIVQPASDKIIRYKAPGVSVILPGAFNSPTQQIGTHIVSVLRMSLLKNVHGITDTAKNAALDAINQGANEGWGYDKTAKTIREDVGSQYRAQRIVRTESVKASNLGAIEGARMTGLKMNKVWLSANDERVRGNPSGLYPNAQFSHWDANGQTQPLDRPFWVGEEIYQPGDPNASAANTIQCRCTVTFKPVRDPVTGRPVRLQQQLTANR